MIAAFPFGPLQAISVIGFELDTRTFLSIFFELQSPLQSIDFHKTCCVESQCCRKKPRKELNNKVPMREELDDSETYFLNAPRSNMICVYICHICTLYLCVHTPWCACVHLSVPVKVWKSWIENAPAPWRLYTRNFISFLPALDREKVVKNMFKI